MWDSMLLKYSLPSTISIATTSYTETLNWTMWSCAMMDTSRLTIEIFFFTTLVFTEKNNLIINDLTII